MPINSPVILGNRLPQNLPEPQKVDNNSWNQVSTFNNFTSGIQSNSLLYTWGINNTYQIGDGTTSNKSLPTQISSSSFSLVSVGFDHSAALTTDSTLFTWGNQPSIQTLTTYDSWSLIAEGGNHSLAIRADGSLWVWGLNNAGQLGDGTTINKSSPIQLGAGTWIDVSVGVSHSLAISNTGQLYVWGHNNVGQTGDGTTINKSSPVLINVVGSSSWSHISAGNSYSLAIDSSNRLFGWGLNNVYQLGDTTTINKSNPVQIKSEISWNNVSAGSDHATAIDINGNLYVWGNFNSAFAPIPTTIYSWIQVNAGGQHTTAIRDDNTLWTWGLNASGQLGLSNTINRSSPVQVSSSSFTQISATYSHTTALKPDNTMLIWGLNSAGQLGDNTTINKSSPVTLGSGFVNTSWSLVSTGLSNTAAIRNDGLLYVWGNNASGQLGNLDSWLSGRSLPVQVGSEFAALDVSGYDLAIQRNSTTYSDSIIPSITGSPVSLFFNGSTRCYFPGIFPQTSVFNTSSTTEFWVNFSDTGVERYIVFLNQFGGDPSPNNINGAGLFRNVNNGFGIQTLGGNGTQLIRTMTANNVVTSGVWYHVAWLLYNAGSDLYLNGVRVAQNIQIVFPFTNGNVFLSRCDINIGSNQFFGYLSNLRIVKDVLVYSGTSFTPPTSILPATQSAGTNISAITAGQTIFLLSTDSSSITNTVASSWSQASAGNNFFMAKKPDGSIWGWGVNTSGQVGIASSTYLGGDTFNRSSPTLVNSSSWLQVSAGFDHTLAIRSDNTLWTWGNWQAIGLVTELKSWTTVYAGGNHSFGVRDDGSVWGWGLNTSGQLGNLSISTRSSPVNVSSTISWTTLSLGGSHTAGLDLTYKLYAWGLNSSGQLGDNTAISKSSPVQVGNDSWAMVKLGASSSVGIKTDNTLWVWGNNANGQLGLLNTINRSSPVQVGVAVLDNSINSFTTVGINMSYTSSIVPSLTGSPVSGVFSGTSFLDYRNSSMLAFLPFNWTVEGWFYQTSFAGSQTLFSAGGTGGFRVFTQTGTGLLSFGLTNIANNETGATVTLNTWYHIAAQAEGNVAFRVYRNGVRTNILISSASWNFSGQPYFSVGSDGGSSNFIGYISNLRVTNFTVYTGTPFTVPTSILSTSQSASTNISAITSNQVGLLLYTTESTSVSLPQSWNSVDAGTNFTVAIKNDNTLWTWGLNTSGQVGDYTTITKSSPVQIGNDSWTSISVGVDHTLAIRSDTTLWTWGNSSAISLVVQPRSWASVSSGASHTLAIRDDGTMWAWGIGTSGQLGNTATLSSSSPVQVGLSSWTSVSAGNNFSLATDINNKLYVWGLGTSGQIGDNTLISKSSPVQIGTSSWTAITAGDTHAFAIKPDGTVWGWGQNNVGQVTAMNAYTSPWSSISLGERVALGIRSDGTLYAWGSNASLGLGVGSINRSSPVLVTSGSWTNISTQNGYSLAIRNDGLLFGWGLNTSGQLGLGDTINRSSPIQIGSSSWTKIAASVSNASGIQSDGTLWSWGNNATGQLGDGTTINQSTPVQIGSSSWTQVDAGGGWMVGLTTNSIINVWGNGVNGVIGNNSTINRSSPTTLGAPYSTSSFTQVTAGSGHILATLPDNTLLAWGQNDFGQLGDNTTISKSNPVQVANINTGLSWSLLFAGNRVSGGVYNNNLYMWGNNTSGTLGDNTLVSKSTPIIINSTYSWIAAASEKLIANTGGATGAVRNDGILFVWGNNATGQLGDGTTITKSSPNVLGSTVISSPVQVGTSSWTTVSAGTSYSVGINSIGLLYAWGLNNLSQLGNVSTNNVESTVVQVTTGSWTKISAGTNHSLAIKSDGTLWGWGNSLAILIAGNVTPASWSQIASDGIASHCAAIKSDGTLWTWGLNTNGQLGDNTTINKSSPTQIGTNSWTNVSVSLSNTMAIRLGGNLFVWGGNGSGQLGDGTTLNKSSPTQLDSNSWSQVSVNSSHAAAIRSNQLYVWGNNVSGQLGLNDTINRSRPVQATGSWSIVSAGTQYTLAIDSANLLFSWGNNAAFQLGDNTTLNKSSPIQIAVGISFTSVSAGPTHAVAIDSNYKLWIWGQQASVGIDVNSWTQVTFPNTGSFGMAIRSDGRLFGWGLNSSGQLGLSDTLFRSSPVLVGSNSWTYVSAGGVYALGIASDGKLFGWGSNTTGEIGIGLTLNRSSPVQISSGTSFTLISAGATHAFAVDTLSRLYAWGQNNLGQLGLNNTINRSAPLQVGSSSWSAVSAGVSFSSGIDTLGKLYLWGFNSTGQLGINTTINRSSPVLVGTTSWTEVSAGTAHTLAITTLGELYAWGQNNAGQLGNNTTLNRSAPIQIGTSSWSSVSAGVSTSIATGIDNTLYAWGLNSSGQLGINTTINRSSPVQLLGGAQWSYITSGLNNGFAISSANATNNKLFVWGNNTGGILGLGNIINLSSPTLLFASAGTVAPTNILNYQSFNQVSTGLSYTIAKRANDNAVMGWGVNNAGQLGDNTLTQSSRSNPTLIGQNNQIDASINQLVPASITGAPKTIDFSPFLNQPYDTIIYGSSMQFSGVTDSIQYATNSVFNIGSNSASAEVWVYFGMFASPINYITLFGQNSGTTSTIRILAINVSTSVSYNYAICYTINDEFYRGITPITTNVWYHTLVTISGGVARFFVNGELEDYITGLGNVITKAENYIFGNENTGFFNGYMSNFRLCNGSIPVSYQTNDTVGVTDQSVNTFTITNSYVTTGTSVVPLINSTAGYFIGTTATVNSYLTVANNSVFQFGTGNFTIEFWIYRTTASTSGVIIVQNAILANNWAIVNVGGAFTFQNGYGVTGRISFTTATLLPQNTWNHVALVRISQQVRFYVNGTLAAGPASDPTNNTGTSDVWIGNGVSYGNFEGYLSNIRVVNGVGVYTGNFTVPTSTLTSTQSSGTNINAITGSQTALLLLTTPASAIQSVPNSIAVPSSPLTTTSQGAIEANVSLLCFQGYPTAYTGNIAAINQTSAFSKSTGELYLTGLGTTGQQGDGTVVSKSNVVQLGSVFTGINTGFNTPLQAATGSWTNVRAGTSFSMAQKNDNTLWVWGLNTSGQLSDNTIITKSSPIQIASSVDIISAGSAHAYYRNSSNLSLYGWGLNTSGQLGIGNAISRSSSTQLGAGQMINTDTFRPSQVDIGTSGYTQVFAGQSYSVVKTYDNLYGWGLNSSGQLGLNNLANRSTPTLIPVNVSIADRSSYSASLTATAVAQSTTFVPSLTTNVVSGLFNGIASRIELPASVNYAFGTEDFTVEFWAYMLAETPGTARIITNRNPNTVGAGTWGITFKSTIIGIEEVVGGGLISASYSSILNQWNHFAVVRQSGGVTFYKNGVALAAAQSFLTNLDNVNFPLTIGQEAYIPGVLYNGYFSNLRIVKGVAVYTGNFTVPTTSLSTSQSSGTNINAVSSSQTTLLLLTTGVSFGVGYSHLLSIDTSGLLYATGLGSSGQLGYGTTASFSSFTLVGNGQIINSGTLSPMQVGFGLPNSWTSVSAGQSYSYAKNSLDQVYVWGINTNGGLALGNTINRSSPTLIGYSVNVISTGQSHVAVTYPNNNLYTVGLNSSGQLGDNTITNRSDPVLVGNYLNTNTTSPILAASASWSATSAGTSHSMAINVDGSLWVWGLNASGQLGQTDTINRSSIVQIGTGTTPVRDESVNNFTVTQNGNTYMVPVTPFAVGNYNISEYGGSILFAPISVADTVTGLSIPINSAFDFGTGQFTMECWIYINDWFGSGDQAIINSGNTSGGGILWMINNLTRKMNFYTGSGNSNPYTAQTPFNSETWYHISVSRNISNQIKFSINGILSDTIVTSAYNFTGNLGGSLLIGRFVANGYSFNGYMSNFRMVKGVTVYTGNFTVPTTPLQISQDAGTNISAITGTQTSLLTGFYINPTVAYIQISAGNSTSVAIKADYTLYTWGLATAGVLGNDSTINRSAPILVGTSSWSLVSTGLSTTLGVDVNNNVYFWGAGGLGQTGANLTTNRSNPTIVQGINYETKSPTLVNGNWSQISAGFSHTVGLIENTLYAWGLNTSGQLGVNSTVLRSSPTVVGTLPTITDSSLNNYAFISPAAGGAPIVSSIGPFVGSPSAFFNNTSASVFYYANATNLQFGTGAFTLECFINLTTASLTKNIINKGSGSGTVTGWTFRVSANTLQFGIASTAYSHPTTLSASIWYHVAVTRDSSNDIRIFVNGISSGVLTNSAYDFTQTDPLRIGYPRGGGGYNDLMRGYISNLRLVKGTALYTANFTPPTTALTAVVGTQLLIAATLPQASFYKLAYAGFQSTYGIQSNDTLYGWGNGAAGEISGYFGTITRSNPMLIGNDFISINQSSPVPIALGSWTKVSAGNSVSAAIRSDSALFTWGSLNTSGQLGLNTTIGRSSPVQIGSSSWTQISAYDTHMIGLDEFDQAYTWGLNASGQLGLTSLFVGGDTINRSNPSIIGNPFTDVLDISTYAFNITQTGTSFSNTIVPIPGSVSGAFRGGASKLELPANAAWAIGATGTVEFWVYSTSTSTFGRRIISCNNGSTTQLDIFIDTLQIGINGPGGQTIVIQPTILNTWYHVAFVFDLGNLTIYFNGVAQAVTGPATGFNYVSTANTLKIGGDFAGGYLSNIRIVKGVAVYTGNFTVPTSVLTVTQSAGTNISAITGAQTSLLTYTTQAATIVGGIPTYFNYVTAGSSFTGGVTTTGSLFMWGLGTTGQLGYGTAANRSSPVAVGGTSSYTSVIAGSANAMALRPDGSLYIWGIAGAQQARIWGTPVNLSSPVQIGNQYAGQGLNYTQIPFLVYPGSWSAVDAGNSITSAISSQDRLFAWGLNATGQIDGNNTINRSSPTQVGQNLYLQTSAGVSNMGVIGKAT